MRYTKISLGVLALIFAVCSSTWAQDPGWPRKLVKPGGTVIIYQPQVDDWQSFTDIKWRSAFQLTPTAGKQIVGAASFEATTEVNTDTHMVFLFNIQVLNTYFPSLDPATSAQMDQLFRTLVPLTATATRTRHIARSHANSNIQWICDWLERYPDLNSRSFARLRMNLEFSA